MAKRLAGKVAWISGGASGIGEGIAELFAKEGAKVAIVDIQVERGQNLAERINALAGEAIYLEADVSKEKQVQDSINLTVKQFGNLDILINSAGTAHFTPLHEYSETDWDYIMGVNLKAIFFSLKHVYPHIKKNKRSYMVNVASISSFIGQASTPAYPTSKHAVLGLSRSIALDYAAIGLRCNCVSPGITDTPLLRTHLNTAEDPEAELAFRLRRVPMGTVMMPNDIAKTALFFACEDSSGITGTSLTIDGGYTTTAEWEIPGKTKFMEDT